MGKVIHVEPEDVWDYFQINKNRLDSIVSGIIAENPDYGVEILISNDGGFVGVHVESDGVEIASASGIYTKDTLIDTVSRFYSSYLDSDMVNRVLSTDNDWAESCEEEIWRREAALDDAVVDLLDVFLAGIDELAWDGDQEMDLVEDLKDFVGEYLYRNHGISIYRPMYLTDSDGKDVFSEYPYEEMLFDDEIEAVPEQMCIM